LRPDDDSADKSNSRAVHETSRVQTRTTREMRKVEARHARR
jgi:hypothetical protein